MHPHSDSQEPLAGAASAGCVAVVGAGRLGSVLAAALREIGVEVEGPLGRGERPGTSQAVILCVPDGEITAAAEVAAGTAPLVGHTSGATPLAAMAPAADAGAALFGFHPLQTFTKGGPAGRAAFAGAGCAVAGTTKAATSFAASLARRLGMAPFEIDDEGRAAYHAAASVASNFMVTLQAAAESIAAGAGLERHEARALLVPLLRRTVDNLAEHGPERALTGPVARGDDATVRAQRAAVEEVAPHLLDLFDELVRHTRSLAEGDAAPEGGRAGRQRDGAGGQGGGAGRQGGPGMRIVRTVDELREALAAERRAGRTIGLVPTMGSFHEGHLSLIRRARADCEVAVVSLFVNPTQFSPTEDLATYPRDERRDAGLAEAEGVDLLFAPALDEVYPDGFDTTVTVGGVTAVLEGDPGGRGPGHFAGVATVVTKLFNMVGPDVAYFGQKDAQQALVIRRLVRDLDIPVRIEVCPTVRDPDGLALSSRNGYLTSDERARALALSRALHAAEAAVDRGERDGSVVLRAARAELDGAGIEPEYLELRSTYDLSPVERVNGTTLLAVAARIGKARLIDNVILGADQEDRSHTT